MDKIYFLSQLSIFKSINKKKLSHLASKARLVEYKKNELIYEQGAPANNFFLIVSGRLKIFSRVSTASKEKIHSYLHKGDFFGEISILTNQPHSVNVQAQNDCILLKIAKNDFEKILKTIPELSLCISKSLGKVLRRKDSANNEIQAHSEIISICSYSDFSDKFQIIADLSLEIAKNGKNEILLLDLSDLHSESDNNKLNIKSITVPDILRREQFSQKELKKLIFRYQKKIDILRISDTKNAPIDEKCIASLMGELCEIYDYILVNIPSDLSDFSLKILEQTDKIFLIVDSKSNILQTSEPIIDSIDFLRTDITYKDVLFLVIYDNKNNNKIIRSLQNLPKKNIDFTLAKKEKTVVGLENYHKDIQKLSRNIRHTSIGLVLGSGAALGLSHIGILKVLEKNKIPIDIIAGCSIGALLGALWACGIKASELEKKALQLTRSKHMLSLFDLTLPTKGFFKGEKIVDFLKNLIGVKTFGETQIKLKIVAADLLSREKIVFDEGPIYKAVRSSISMPGIFEPVRENNRYQVDGGILDPVPVDILQESGATRIIAVNALPNLQCLKDHQEKLLDRSDLNLIDILTRAIQTMEYGLAESACREADITIRPLENYHSYFEFLNAEELITKGEEAAEKAIEKIKTLINKN